MKNTYFTTTLAIAVILTVFALAVALIPHGSYDVVIPGGLIVR